MGAAPKVRFLITGPIKDPLTLSTRLIQNYHPVLLLVLLSLRFRLKKVTELTLWAHLYSCQRPFFTRDRFFTIVAGATKASASLHGARE